MRTSLSALVAVALVLPGCCAAAQYLCKIEPPKSPPRATRDTPDAAVDFLVEAFRNRAIDDLYDSLSPEYRRQNGDFGSSEFAIAYDKYEDLFRADAESLAAASRTPVNAGPTAAYRAIRLVNDKNGAEAVIVFVDHPKIRLVTSNQFIPPFGDTVDFERLVQLEDGTLHLPAAFDLTKMQGVSREMVAPLRTADLERVEIFHNWVVFDIPQDRAKNIQFLVKLRELTSK